MKGLKSTVVAAAAVLALAACQQNTVDVAAVETESKNALRTWITAFNAGDVDTIVALYAPDAVVMPPGVPAAAGHDAIRATIATLSEGTRAAGVSLAAGDGDVVGVSGDLAWHSGSWTANDGAGNEVDSGSFLAVLQNFDGKWLMIRDTWNSNRPPPAAAAEPDEAATAEGTPST